MRAKDIMILGACLVVAVIGMVVHASGASEAPQQPTAVTAEVAPSAPATEVCAAEIAEALKRHGCTIQVGVVFDDDGKIQPLIRVVAARKPQ